MNSASADRTFQKNMMASFVKMGAVLLLLIWCFQIIAPFLNIMFWAMILAVALYPAHLLLTKKLGGHQNVSAISLVIVGLAIVIVPAYLMAESSILSLSRFGHDLHQGTVAIAPADKSVAGWPFVGERVFLLWSDAATNLEGTLNKYQHQLQVAGSFVLKMAGGMFLGVLQFIASVMIAGVFLVRAKSLHQTSKNLAWSLVGSQGEKLVRLTISTIRNIAQGVLGIAFTQAALAALGLVVMDVPAAGLWAGIVLILAIVQFPPILVMGPIAVWVFSVAAPVPATIFAVYAVIVSIADAFLKPIFLGRGMDIPMLVILLGAIGGAMLSGVIGLFVGAVILALGYEMVKAWMTTDELNNPKEFKEDKASD